MLARVFIHKGVGERYNEGVELYREKVVPEVEKQPGFAGALLLANRDADLAYSITFWESEEALHATDELGKQLAEAAAKELHSEFSEGHFTVEVSKLPALVA
jgi:heme-degrading monooxygenase HmoA